MHMACVAAGKDFKQWFAELNVDLDKVGFSFLDVYQPIF